MKIILGTANFNTSYGLLKNKLKKNDFIEIIDICKKKKLIKLILLQNIKIFQKY